MALECCALLLKSVDGFQSATLGVQILNRCANTGRFGAIGAVLLMHPAVAAAAHDCCSSTIAVELPLTFCNV